MNYKIKNFFGKLILDNPISKSLKSEKYSTFKLNVSEISPDPRDWKHAKRKISSKDIDAKEFSRRSISPRVKNQGSIGSCVGHSGRVILGSAQKFKKEEPSPMWIYQKGKKYDPWAGEDYSGTSIRGAAMAVKTEGCCFESFWPYVAREDSQPKEGAKQDAEQKKIHGFYVIPKNETKEIKSMLIDRPLWYAFMVHDYFFSIGFDGIVDSKKYLNSTKAGGHAVAMIGWKTINGKLYWEFQNSWGIFHGNLGCFYLDDELFQRIIINSIGPYYLDIHEGYVNPKPEPVDPEPVDPEPVDPEPVDPEPVDPEPVDPEPVDPEPVDPEPVDPEPVDPEPVDPEPVDPEPVDPEPVDPEPVDPEPVDPEPVDPEPVDPEPVDPEPVDPEPVDPDKKPKIISFIIVGLLAITGICLYFFKQCSDIPEVDFDKKFEEEMRLLKNKEQ